METNEITKTFTRSVAQASLFRSVYVWMTLALVITGFTARYPQDASADQQSGETCRSGSLRTGNRGKRSYRSNS